MTLCDTSKPLYLLYFLTFWNIILQNHKVF
uniref:Uncharacterized protein n=1 Tax=Siphoviridae sp. ctEIp38 TaxID=2825394 RepID=A0A8S5QFJ6_9CAUD|nr:MAG TPA: hypothetical protein [Siphoviridae sp. ctEIp38]